MRAATAAAHAVASPTQRRSEARRDPVVSVVVTWAGLLAGAGLRCRHAAVSGGPASAVARIRPARAQPRLDEASRLSAARASAAPATAAGQATAAVLHSISAATWRSEPPRARTMASSPARRTAIIRAATAMTAAPVTIRLTMSSSRTVSIAARVPRNVARNVESPEETVTAVAAGLRSPMAGAATEKWLSVLSMTCAWLARIWPVASGNSHWTSGFEELSSACMATSSPGSANTAPSQ